MSAIKLLSPTAAPRYLSNELCNFLGVPFNTYMKATKVINTVLEYCKYNKLIIDNFVVIDSNIAMLINSSDPGRYINRRISIANLQSIIYQHLSNMPFNQVQTRAVIVGPNDIVATSMQDFVHQLHSSEKLNLLYMIINDLRLNHNYDIRIDNA